MIHRPVEEVPVTPIEIDGAERVSMRVVVGREEQAPNFAMRHFTVEPGGHTPRHSHNYEHEVYVISGNGTVEQEGTFESIHGGDALYIEANTIHQFVNNGSEPLKFLCFVPVSFDCATGGYRPTPGT